jgi:hypothetical protein
VSIETPIRTKFTPYAVRRDGRLFLSVPAVVYGQHITTYEITPQQAAEILASLAKVLFDTASGVAQKPPA